jgi:hypothetical protein
MFSAMRRRMHFSPATVIASLALVFAMTGGAYAASKVLITSTKQISPKVLKALQGKTGPAGAQGSVGVPGPAGAQGPAGPTGPQGPAGAKGETGTAGVNGTGVTSTALAPKNANCKEGGSEFTSASGKTYACNGREGTFGGQALPEGKTLRGVWAAAGYGEAAFLEPGFGEAKTGVSFALPLSIVPSVHYIKQGEADPEGCTGSRNEPQAAEGNLCIFGAEEENLFGTPFISLAGGTEVTYGFVISDSGAAKGAILMEGSWAVTG